jgi:predicted  nucleic acid-binding Zn-ribbon protein|tara:strand:+ start:2070 stop:2348 length:279 start_codon:yes stop_codon:yes gene_type:complete
MKISDLETIKEAPIADPVKSAQEALQQAKEGVVAIQAQMTQLAAQKKAADEQVRAATQAVATAQKAKTNMARQQTGTMGTPNTQQTMSPTAQ